MSNLPIGSISGIPSPSPKPQQSGFTLIEILIGMVAGSIILAGAYGLMKTHNEEGFRIERKIELRGEMTLSSKRIQRAITLAGIGMNGSPVLKKDDAIGSDTLTIFTNAAETKSKLSSDANASAPILNVDEPSLFNHATFVAVVSDGFGEIRMITGQSGSTLHLDSAFSRTFTAAASIAYPASRERYYSDQDSCVLILEEDGEPRIIAKKLTNFQVSFRDRHGESTVAMGQVRTVQFSFTGVYPAKEGALNSIVFSSTAIPRNAL